MSLQDMNKVTHVLPFHLRDECDLVHKFTL